MSGYIKDFTSTKINLKALSHIFLQAYGRAAPACNCFILLFIT